VIAGDGLAVGGTATTPRSRPARGGSNERRGPRHLALSSSPAMLSAHPRACTPSVRAELAPSWAAAEAGSDRAPRSGQRAVAVLVVRCEQLVATPFSFGAGRARISEWSSASGRLDRRRRAGCALVLPDALGCNPAALLAQLHEALASCPVLAVAGGRDVRALQTRRPCRRARRGGLRAGAGHRRGAGLHADRRALLSRTPRRTWIQRIREPPAWMMLGKPPRASGRGGAIRQAGVVRRLAMDPAKIAARARRLPVRNLVAPTGRAALAVAEHVRVGQTLQSQIRDAQASREDLCGSSTRWRAPGRAGGRPSAATSTARGAARALPASPITDVTLIRERLGEFPARRILRTASSRRSAAGTSFHNYTGALVIFPEA